MKTLYKTKKLISTFLSSISCLILLLSISSCEMFNFTNNEENSNTTNITEQTAQASAFTLLINPKFSELEKQNSRSAYPDFSEVFSSVSFFNVSSNDSLFPITTGSYDSDNNQISFLIASSSFSNKEIIVTAFDASNKPLFMGVTEISYTEGSSVTATIYFVPVSLGSNKGYIDLNITVPSGYTLSCEIKDRYGIIVSSDNTDDGKDIITDSSGRIYTLATGISSDKYTAYISVYKDFQLYDYIIQEINVWPGLTTKLWYLSDGNTSDILNVVPSTDIKLYVKRTNPTGLYGPSGLTGVADAADTNSGSIMQPLSSINAALSKCIDSSTDYTIICDGDFSDGFEFGNPGDANYKSSNITVMGGGNSDSLSTINGSVTITTKANFTLENIKISGSGSGNGINFNTSGSISSGRILTLNNCEISNWTKAIEMEITAADSKLVIKGSTYIPPKADDLNYIYLDNCKIYIDGPLDTSGDTSGLRSVASIQVASESIGTQYIFAENGANLALESQRFEYLDFPKVINTEGKLAYTKDFYVAASTATPAGSSTGNGSATRPFDTVTAAVAKINDLASSTDGAGDYTIHISGTIKENDTINLVGSNNGTLSSFYIYNSTSTLTLCGTNKETDILDGNGSHQVLNIQGNPSYRLPVTIENLTIQNGNTTNGSGGGIYVSNATLKLGNGCVITKNKTTSSGGGIYASAANLFVYGDALIGYTADEIPAAAYDETVLTSDGNVSTNYGGGIYISATSSFNDSNIWIGYTAENEPDTSDSSCSISGNYTEFNANGGGIYVGNNTSFHMCKGKISYNGAFYGGGIYFETGKTGEITGGNIIGNKALTRGGSGGFGGGIYCSSTTNNLHLSGNTLIKDNVADESGGAIYSYGFEIEGSVSIPFNDVKKNDVYLPWLKQIKITGNLEPPAEANGITATITLASYDTTSDLLIDDDSGTTVAANYDKLAVTPEGTKRWKLDSDGYLYLPFKVIVNDVTYTKKADCIAAITDTSLSGLAITVTVLEADASDFGRAAIEGTILNAIQNTKAKTVDLIVDENANIKLPANSSQYFQNCVHLHNVNLAGIDTSDVTNMHMMFIGSFGNNLTDFPEDAVLDIRSFNTANVSEMYNMFTACKNLKTIIVGSDFVTDHVTPQNGESMFQNCDKLVGAFGSKPDNTKSGVEFAHIDGGSSNPGYFTAASYVGSKLPLEPKEVGDIVFNDGSSMPSTDFTDLDTSVQNEKKTAAIALIFYKGTDCNNDGDTTVRTLGVGLKHAKRDWCTDGVNAGDSRANAFNINITTIQCTPHGNGFTGDKDGSNNLEQIADFLEAESASNPDVTDDTSGDAAAKKYPAFYFAKNYKDEKIGGETESRIQAGSEFATGWYFPSLAELFQIYEKGKGTSKVFDINAISQALGGNTFGDDYFISSSQYYSDSDSDSAMKIYRFYFKNSQCLTAQKTSVVGGWPTCAIREF